MNQNIYNQSHFDLQQLDKDERSDVESEPEVEENEEEQEKEEDQSSWRKRKVVLDSRLAMLSSSCVLNNLTNQKADTNRRLPKARQQRCLSSFIHKILSCTVSETQTTQITLIYTSNQLNDEVFMREWQINDFLHEILFIQLHLVSLLKEQN